MIIKWNPNVYKTFKIPEFDLKVDMFSNYSYLLKISLASKRHAQVINIMKHDRWLTWFHSLSF